MSLTKDAEAGTATNAHAYIYSLPVTSRGLGDLVVTYSATPAKGASVSARVVGQLLSAGAKDQSAIGTGSSTALVTYKQSQTPTCSVYGRCSKQGSLDFSGTVMRWCDGTYWRQIKTN